MFVGGRAGELPDILVFNRMQMCHRTKNKHDPTSSTNSARRKLFLPTKSVTVAVDSLLIYVWSHSFASLRTHLMTWAKLCVCGAVNRFLLSDGNAIGLAQV